MVGLLDRDTRNDFTGDVHVVCAGAVNREAPVHVPVACVGVCVCAAGGTIRLVHAVVA